MATQQRISADTLLPDCPENRAGLDLPAPISERLDDLVRLAEAAGDRTNRKELVACLILAAPEAGEDVSNLLRAYRTSPARMARPSSGRDEAVINIRTHRPGPRPRQRP